MSLCKKRISLTTEPIWFSFTGLLFIGPGKVFNYFGVGYHNPPKKNRPSKIEKNYPTSKKLYFIKTEIKIGGQSNPPSHRNRVFTFSFCSRNKNQVIEFNSSQRPLGAQPREWRTNEICWRPLLQRSMEPCKKM